MAKGAFWKLKELLKGNVKMTTRKRLLSCYVFSALKIWLWKLDSEQESNEKNQCFWTVVLSEDVKNQLERQSTKYRGSEKSWRKGTTILQENCATEIGVCWTCIKRKQWKKCIVTTRRKNQGQNSKRQTQENVVWWHMIMMNDPADPSSDVDLLSVIKVFLLGQWKNR